MEKCADRGSLGSGVWIRVSVTSGEAGVKRTQQGGFREPGGGGGWGKVWKAWEGAGGRARLPQ